MKRKHLFYCSECYIKIPEEDKIEQPIQVKIRQETRCNSCNKTFFAHSTLMQFPLEGVKLHYLRKCNKCGFEAHTVKDLELFKTHSRYDKYYSSYPYGKDPVCLKCYREYDNKAHRTWLATDPVKAEKCRKSRMDSYYMDKSKNKARDYSFRHLKTDKSCALCGAKNVPLQKHHPDYTRPEYVITLCRSCHHKLHVNKRVSTQDKPTLCKSCVNREPRKPNELFPCTFWNRYVTTGQERKNYCKGYSAMPNEVIKRKEEVEIYYCDKLKRNLKTDELFKNNCLKQQLRHRCTFCHSFGRCPKLKESNQLIISLKAE
jgi:hypothetical protein